MLTVGWIALGSWFGETMKARFSIPLSDTILAGAGAALVSLLTDVLKFIPIAGAPLMPLVSTLGIAACLLTQFGFRTFTPRSDTDLL